LVTWRLNKNTLNFNLTPDIIFAVAKNNYHTIHIAFFAYKQLDQHANIRGYFKIKLKSCTHVR
jgi:hypothetical protein